MVIALENATKLMPILLSSEKEYIAIMHVHKEITKKKIEKACNEFVGKIKQTPPVKSAVARVEREREIYFLEILEIEGRDVLMKIGCQAGMYVRVLCDQIGKRLGIGAHMAELRRIRSGVFSEDQMIKLQDLQDAYVFWKENGDDSYLKNILYPLEKAADNIKNVVIKDSAIEAICNGAPLAVNGLLRIQAGIERNELVGMFSLKGELIAIGKSLMESEEMFKAKKGLAIKTDRVLMKKGTYPLFRKKSKMWRSV